MIFPQLTINVPIYSIEGIRIYSTLYYRTQLVGFRLSKKYTTNKFTIDVDIT